MSYQKSLHILCEFDFMNRLIHMVTVGLICLQPVLSFASILNDAGDAIRNGHIEKLAQILRNSQHIETLKGQMYDVTMEDGATILLHAALHGGEAFHLVNEALEPEWSRQGPNGQIPGLTDSQVSPLELIGTGRFDVFAKDIDGKTLLHCAAEANDIEAIQLILSKGGRAAGTLLNAQNQKEETPLFEAVASYSNGAVELLLRKGADPKIGVSPLLPIIRSEIHDEQELSDIAQGAEPRPIRSIEEINRSRVENLHIAQMLLDAGAAPTQADPASGVSFFSLAKMYSLSDCVKIALSSSHFDWKKEIRNDVRMLDYLPKYLRRQRGALVDRGDELVAYSHVSNYLDMVQVGLGMECSICSSLAGTRFNGQSPTGIDGELKMMPIAVHSCGNGFCEACRSRWDRQQLLDHEAIRRAELYPTERWPVCAMCREVGHYHLVSPSISLKKDKRLEGQRSVVASLDPSDGNASERPAKRARTAE